MYKQPKAASSLLSSVIPQLPHDCVGVLAVPTESPHRLHSEYHTSLPSVLWSEGSSSISVKELLSACGVPGSSS